MRIGIICSHIREGNEILKVIKKKKERKEDKLKIWEGFFKKHKLILITNALGRDLASLAVSLLIKEFKVEIIINCGGAGAINPKRKVKDIIIGREFIEYKDYSHHDYLKIGEDNLNLVNQFKELITSSHFKIYEGLVVSGNENVGSQNLKRVLWERSQAECIDWESATVAKLAILNKTPFLIIRGISDFAEENYKKEFYQNIEEVVKVYSKILILYLAKISI
jgi:adenosylhomocysteine nucleosidase